MCSDVLMEPYVLMWKKETILLNISFLAFGTNFLDVE